MAKYYFKLFLLLIIAASSATLRAQNFGLVKDINTSKDANPVNYINDLYLRLDNDFFINTTANSKYAVMNGIAFFSADDGIHGTELWRSDGTATGTYMVKDFNPGSGSSQIQSLTVVGTKLYFTESNVLYASDGTEVGTYTVPGITYNGDVTTCLTPVGNQLYFFTNLSRLWKTDGTLAGTSLVIDFRGLFGGQRDFLGQLTNVNGTLFFTTGIDYSDGVELWKSDGTMTGTMMVKDIYQGPNGSEPLQLTSLNGKLYFSANDGTGIHVWVSDGTEAGTQPLINNSGVVLAHNVYAPFTVMNNELYFEGATTSMGYELFKYNPAKSTAGIKLVKDINAGSLSSYPGNLTTVGNTLYFTVYNATGDQELWKSDGQPAGTNLVKNIDPGYTTYFANLTNANGQLLFSYYTPSTGYELWKSDGTDAGTVIIKDIYSGLHSSNATNITYLKNGVYIFNANDGLKGIELWRTNGTYSGTTLIKNINSTTTANSNPSFTGFTFNNKMFFSAYDPQYGFGLYTTDGTTGGTQLLKDLYPGNSPLPQYFTLFKGAVYFAADSGQHKRLYKTDGTAEGTLPFFDFNSKNYQVLDIKSANSFMYIFIFKSDSLQYELWRSDGTTGGTFMVSSLPGYGYNSIVLGHTLFFSCSDSAHGYELWKSLGTASSTKLLKDIMPGTANSNPTGFTILNGKVYFGAEDAPNIIHLYVTNGSTTGTTTVGNVKLGGYFQSVQANGKIFFNGLSDTAGREPFVSDGTPEGTKLLKNIYPGQFDSYPDNFVAIDSTIYFRAYNDLNGNELWKTNGKPEGTVMVKDIVPGTNSSFPSWINAVSGKLYFMADDSFYVPHLWVSNGKSSGTYQIVDAGLSGVNIATLVGSPNKIFIIGSTYATGYELYAGAVPGYVSAYTVKPKENIIPKTNKFKVSLLGNPVRDELNIQVNTTKSQPAQILIIDISGKVIINNKQILSAGINMFSYPAKLWAGGGYIIKVTTDDGASASLKFVK